MFPKDWKMDRETLIRLWMAEGFFQSSEMLNLRSIEDIGNYYFQLLSSNSFFQDLEKDELGVIMRCKMHDVVHDLAISVVGSNEFGIVKVSAGKEDVSQVRRLQLICDIGSSTTTSQVLRNAKKLRTVIVLHPEYCSQVISFSSAKRLRIVYPLSVWGKKYSFSVSKLKHLRYLNLSDCEFDSSHDVSLNHSYNLQTLILRSCKNVSGFLGEMGHLKYLRHLDVSYSDIKVLPDDFTVHLTNLQTLDLQRCKQFQALPEKMESLKKLSYLNLSYSSSITKIPDSVTFLSNLITFDFEDCWNLEALPRELGALTRLRRLDFAATKIKVLPESCISNLYNLEIVNFGWTCELPREIKNWPKLRSFKHQRGDTMPRGIEKLTCLETLWPYMVRKEEEDNCSNGHSGIKELADLNSLQMLIISSLENVRGGKEDAERAKLKDKKNLRELKLNWRSNGDDEYDDMVLEGLQPHQNLRKLVISGFSGIKLPTWMGTLSSCMLPNLVSLMFGNCKRCEKLPSLGMLPSLRDLTILGLKSVKCLGREFYCQQQHEEEKGGNNTQKSTTTTVSFFPSLVELVISDMQNLEEWVAPVNENSFPLLEKLNLQYRRKLKSVPNSFPSLKQLHLVATNDKEVNSILSATARGGCLKYLTSIQIDHSPEMIYFPLGILLQNKTPNLHSLLINYCSEFQGFRDDDDHLNNNYSNSSIQRFEIYSCPVLTSLPDLRLWTSLRKLVLRKCDKLKESISYDLKTSLSSLDSLHVDFL
ncbi:putative disease resistance RPP13-like protein 1 [Papaver somniferum]|uniref:putative disease resistance RPP13-like protein 1 n=1 Tax=Papaver somniferum TaxID=3469 RepID=UPI000E6FF290|nr:putative disease resistance RPP13-like protein 1 [Papaver somniferum]